MIDGITNDAQRLEKAATPVLVPLSAEQAAQLTTLIQRVQTDMKGTQTALDSFKASPKSAQLQALTLRAEAR